MNNDRSRQRCQIQRTPNNSEEHKKSNVEQQPTATITTFRVRCGGCRWWRYYAAYTHHPSATRTEASGMFHYHGRHTSNPVFFSAFNHAVISDSSHNSARVILGLIETLRRGDVSRRYPSIGQKYFTTDLVWSPGSLLSSTAVLLV